MKSPNGLIWNTPSRRKRFAREYCDFKAAELERFWEEWESLEARELESPKSPKLRLVEASQAESG